MRHIMITFGNVTIESNLNTVKSLLIKHFQNKSFITIISKLNRNNEFVSNKKNSSEKKLELIVQD